MEKEVLESYMQAGRINFEALNLGERLSKPESSMTEILDQIEEYIKSKGAWPAFPAQMSINNVAAHFCPAGTDTILKQGDVIKLDVGVSVNGYIADSARTIDLGDNKELVMASRDALNAALAVVKTGVEIGEIGEAIHEAITKRGFTPIKNLSGHGLGRFQVHASPSIPNIATGMKTILKENQVIAIEPFATNGVGIVYESGAPTVFSLLKEKQLRSPSSRKILQDIKKYEGLPFTNRWLIPTYGVAATQLALREMMQAGILHAHPPLLEKGKGLVAQSEHSVIVRDKPIIYTKYDD
ncbi:MAG: type II methionyl aminopeptidase [Candidatus Nanoarchaeia archaeon]